MNRPALFLFALDVMRKKSIIKSIVSVLFEEFIDTNSNRGALGLAFGSNDEAENENQRDKLAPHEMEKKSYYYFLITTR